MRSLGIIGLRIGRTAEYAILLALGILYSFPFLWMLGTSLKPDAETVRFPPTLWPSEFHFENYAYVLNSGPFARFLLNSVVVAVAIVLIVIVTSVPAAYAFAKMRFRGSGIVFSIILSAMLIPMQVTVLPVYLLFSKIGWVNSYEALIIPFISSAFAIFLLTQAFRQISDDLIEASRMDGATEFRILWQVVLPMAKSSLVMLVLFTFIVHWNDLFWVNVMTTSDTYRTLTVGVMRLRDMESTRWNILMAGNVILIAPVLLMYLFASSKIKTAFVYSGIK